MRFPRHRDCRAHELARLFSRISDGPILAGIESGGAAEAFEASLVCRGKEDVGAGVGEGGLEREEG